MTLAPDIDSRIISLQRGINKYHDVLRIHRLWKFADNGESSPLSDFLKCIWHELFFLFFVVQHILHNNSRVQKRGKFLKIRGFLSKILLLYTDICPRDWDLVNLNQSCLSRHNVDIYSKDLSVNANISLKNVVMLSFALGENVNNAAPTHW